MGLLAKFLNAELDTSKRVTNDFWFGRSFVGVSSAGTWVSTERARTVAAVYACVKVLSEDIAKLPLFVYQRGSDGSRTTKDKAYDHPLYELLHYQPNVWQSSFEWREMMMGHALLRGNAYSEIIPGARGIDQLIPRHPDRVQVVQTDDGTLGYIWYPQDSEPVAIPWSRMFHLRGYSSDGIRGDSVVAAMRDTLGHSIAANEHGARFFKNSAQIPFAIKHPGKLTEPAFKRLVRAQEEQSGVENAGKSMILEEGMSIEKLGITNEDSQYLETREFQTAEVCRFFRMPPHKIADLKRATFSNIEHQSIEYVVDTLMPWCARIEGAGRRDLISQKGKFWIEFQLQGLLRGDSASRSNYYSSGIRTGWMSRNEAREFENMNPVDGLDEFLSDLSMAPEDESDDRDAEPRRDEDDEDDGADARTEAIVTELCRKFVQQEQRALEKDRENKDRARLYSTFYAAHKARLMKALFLSDEAASAYCSRRLIQEAANPLSGIETWDMLTAELVGLALGRKR